MRVTEHEDGVRRDGGKGSRQRVAGLRLLECRSGPLPLLSAPAQSAACRAHGLPSPRVAGVPQGAVPLGLSRINRRWRVRVGHYVARTARVLDALSCSGAHIFKRMVKKEPQEDS